MLRLEAHPTRVTARGPPQELEEKLFPILRVPNPGYRFLLKKLHKAIRGLPEDSPKRRELKDYLERARWKHFYRASSRGVSFPIGLLPRVVSELSKTTRARYPLNQRHKRGEQEGGRGGDKEGISSPNLLLSLNGRRPEASEASDGEREKGHNGHNDQGIQLQDFRSELPDLLPAEILFQDRVEPRAEQLRVLDSAIRAGSGLIHAKPNFGKTEIACAIIALYRERVGTWPRTLFLVHRTGLASQARERFASHLGIDVGQLGDRKRDIQPVTVSTVQTLTRILKTEEGRELVHSCQLVFLDEIHVNQGRQAYSILSQCPARMRYGLSGTITKQRGERLLRMEQLVGPVVAEATNQELVGLGRSALPVIRLVRVKASEITGPYRRAYREAVVEHEIRNATVLAEVVRYVEKDYRVLVLVTMLRHGRLLRDRLDYLDIGAAFLEGRTPLPVREELKRKFQRGKLPVLIASTVFDVGEDLPEIDAAVFAGAGKGWEVVVQRIGRVMRRKTQRREVYVSDFLDTHNKYLLKHSVARWTHYRNEKFKIQVRR